MIGRSEYVSPFLSSKSLATLMEFNTTITCPKTRNDMISPAIPVRKDFPRKKVRYHIFSKIGYTQARESPSGFREDCRLLVTDVDQGDKIALHVFDSRE